MIRRYSGEKRADTSAVTADNAKYHAATFVVRVAGASANQRSSGIALQVKHNLFYAAVTKMALFMISFVVHYEEIPISYAV